MEPLDDGPRSERHANITDTFLPFTEAFWGTRFNWKGNSLGQERQEDDTSCGACAINFLQRLVDTSIPLWTPQGAAGYRVSLFLLMAHHAIGEIVSL